MYIPIPSQYLPITVYLTLSTRSSKPHGHGILRSRAPKEPQPSEHIVEIVSFFKLRDLKVVFVMEYLEGGELGKYLKSKGRLTEDEARPIMQQLVDAVHFCHMNKIIHRDLKPENILFESSSSQTIKVVDFGIAGFYSGYRFDVTNAGSLRYMAPEILTGRNRAANPAIDVWSIGCILYGLLQGQPPFMGTKKEITDAIVRGSYKFDQQSPNPLSAECMDLIQRMLTVDYTSRISTFDILKHPWLKGELAVTLISEPLEEKEPALEKVDLKALLKNQHLFKARSSKEKPGSMSFPVNRDKDKDKDKDKGNILPEIKAGHWSERHRGGIL